MANGKAKGAPNKVRGEYRCIYEAMYDDPAWQQLSPEARAVFQPLKGRAGTLGLKVIPALRHALSEWTGYPLDTVSHSLEELLAGGWIALEGNLVWVRKWGLDFEPSVTRNNPKHRTMVAEQLKPFPRTGLVAAFRSANAHWLVGVPDTVSDTVPEPSPPLPVPSPVSDGRPDWLLLLDEIQGPARGAWQADLEALCAGMPGHHHLTLEERDRVCRDYRGRDRTRWPDTTLKGFRAFVGDHIRHRGADAGAAGSDSERALRRAEQGVPA